MIAVIICCTNFLRGKIEMLQISIKISTFRWTDEQVIHIVNREKAKIKLIYEKTTVWIKNYLDLF